MPGFRRSFGIARYTNTGTSDSENCRRNTTKPARVPHSMVHLRGEPAAGARQKSFGTARTLNPQYGSGKRGSTNSALRL